MLLFRQLSSRRGACTFVVALIDGPEVDEIKKAGAGHRAARYVTRAVQLSAAVSVTTEQRHLDDAG